MHLVLFSIYLVKHMLFSISTVNFNTTTITIMLQRHAFMQFVLISDLAILRVFSLSVSTFVTLQSPADLHFLTEYLLISDPPFPLSTQTITNFVHPLNFLMFIVKSYSILSCTVFSGLNNKFEFCSEYSNKPSFPNKT
jgi:hypothetical protein